jgi:hypothetical protein
MWSTRRCVSEPEDQTPCPESRQIGIPHRGLGVGCRAELGRVALQAQMPIREAGGRFDGRDHPALKEQ